MKEPTQSREVLDSGGRYYIQEDTYRLRELYPFYSTEKIKCPKCKRKHDVRYLEGLGDTCGCGWRLAFMQESDGGSSSFVIARKPSGRPLYPPPPMGSPKNKLDSADALKVTQLKERIEKAFPQIIEAYNQCAHLLTKDQPLDKEDKERLNRSWKAIKIYETQKS